MNEKQIKEAIAAGFDEAMTAKLSPMIGEIAAAKAKEIVANMNLSKGVIPNGGVHLGVSSI